MTIRKDIAKLAGPWAPEMEWYARAVAQLQTRPFTDRTSWLFLGAIHGIDVNGWINAGIVQSAADVPPAVELEQRLDQCQHQGWFFLPWHRGYLAAFEAILKDWIVSQGGPADWALPYWNYLNFNNPNSMALPPEFLDATLPDGTPNPLSAPPRRAGLTTLAIFPPNTITLTAQTEPVYTAVPGTMGYGGPISGFTQSGNANGGVESDPHNLVHVMISGWMGNPNYAALDPIFWLHHCNIDRLWEAWMSDPAHSQEVTAPWRNGPFPRQYQMPTTTGGVFTFVPDETLPGSHLAPTYDNLSDGTGIIPALPAVAAINTGGTMSGKSSLVGANATKIKISRTAATSSLAIEQRDQVMGAIDLGERIFLNLEGIKGVDDGCFLTIHIILPTGDGGAGNREYVKTIGLFGLAKASDSAGLHGGNGITAAVEITDIVKRLKQSGNLDNLQVELSKPEYEDSDEEIVVDRISVYRQSIA